MKNWLIVTLISFLILVGGVFIFIPRNIIVTKVTTVDCAANAIFRTLCNEDKWLVWFPYGKDSTSFNLNGDTLRIGKKFPNTIELLITQKDGNRITSIITILDLPENKAAIHWQCMFPTGVNPIKRILQYTKAVKIKSDITEVLNRLDSFLQKKENIYGVKMETSSTRDTVMIATKSIYKSYPTTSEIYGLIGILKQYISEQGAKETSHPMLNVTQTKSDEFQVMVAIPIDKVLLGNEVIFPKRMVPGNFITGQVEGGVFSINNALHQMDLYFQDNSKLSMAIPFQYLITDRSKQQDTNKWITKIYAPVFR